MPASRSQLTPLPIGKAFLAKLDFVPMKLNPFRLILIHFPPPGGGDGAIHVCELTGCRLPPERWWDDGGKGGNGGGGRAQGRQNLKARL